jgi:hypothetical protein
MYNIYKHTSTFQGNLAIIQSTPVDNALSTEECDRKIERLLAIEYAKTMQEYQRTGYDYQNKLATEIVCNNVSYPKGEGEEFLPMFYYQPCT